MANEQVDRVNSILDAITARPFACAALAAQAIRAALLFAGIALPTLEVETPYVGNAGGSTEDGKFILHRAENGTDPVMYAPPVEGEWMFKIMGSDDSDDYDLHLYIAMDLTTQNFIECYAQILDSEEASDVNNMDNVSDQEYTELVGNDESDYIERQRHIGSGSKEAS